jgi:hypothetical protein
MRPFDYEASWRDWTDAVDRVLHLQLEMEKWEAEHS